MLNRGDLGSSRHFGMRETYTCSQGEGKQALVRDDLKIQELYRITDGRCLKLCYVGIFMTSWGHGV